MNDSERLELEGRIHSLLCGSLSEAERRRLLRRIAEQKQTRRLVCEMLRVQEDARSAFGLDPSDAEIEESLQRAISKIPAGVGRTAEASRRPKAGRLMRSSAFAWAAAAIAVAASLLLAIANYHTNQGLVQRLAEIQPEARRAPAAQMPRVTAADLANYRRLWHTIDDPTDDVRPWVLLRNGGGRFGYLRIDGPEGLAGQLLLVRCLLVAVDGRGVRRVNLVLPARKSIRLDLPDVGQLGGRPLQCRVSAEEGWTTFSVQIGSSAEADVGLTGRAKVGGGPVELGRFHLDGRAFDVFVDALPFGQEIG